MGDFKIVGIAPGVRVVSVKTDVFKTGRIVMSMAMPIAKNTAAQAILPFYLRRACKQYPDFTELNGRLNELYGTRLSAGVSKSGDFQKLSINMSFIDDRFSLTDESISAECVKLITGMLFEPLVSDGGFVEKNIEQEKRLLIEKRRSELDDKVVYARSRCEEIMCADEPYGRNVYGTEEEILALTPADVYETWQNVLKESIIQFTVISSADTAEIENILKGKFSGIERSVIEKSAVPVRNAGEVKYVNEAQPVKQGKLVMGFRSEMEKSEKNRFKNMIMADLFGGGPHSKLFMNVREKMSLCYYCRARFLRDNSIMFVESGIETHNEEKARQAISDQLNKVKNGDFTDDELKASKMSVSDSLQTFKDTPEVLAAWYALQSTDESPISLREACEGVEKVSRQDVIDMSRVIELDTVYMLSGTEGGEA
ncbi:MAG: insulinase family protein [Clostridiales bacterium]|nr:insulinase family protein [Clostridiales bacterium]